MWLQPNSLEEFLHLKWKHPDARVVVGNTEVGQSASQTYLVIHPFIQSSIHPVIQSFIHPVIQSSIHDTLFVGIEVKFKNMLYAVVLAPVFVPELNAVTHTEDGELSPNTPTHIKYD